MTVFVSGLEEITPDLVAEVPGEGNVVPAALRTAENGQGEIWFTIYLYLTLFGAGVLQSSTCFR